MNSGDLLAYPALTAPPSRDSSGSAPAQVVEPFSANGDRTAPERAVPLTPSPAGEAIAAPTDGASVVPLDAPQAGGDGDTRTSAPNVSSTEERCRYVAHRQAEGVRRERDVPTDDGRSERRLVRVRDLTNASINRELQILKRIFSLAQKTGRLAQRPYIALLREDNVRKGFFEAHQFNDVLAHLPEEYRPVVRFASITGWRVPSEVLPLEWRNVDFKAGEVRLDAGTTKNGEGRVFPMTSELRQLLEAQQDENKTLKKAGHIVPWAFVRMVAKGRRGPKEPERIYSFTKSWKAACVAAGVPGRILHDLRRTAVRNNVRVGIPERVAMTMTGHKTRSVFERYNIVSSGDLRDAARKLDAVPNIPQQQAQ